MRQDSPTDAVIAAIRHGRDDVVIVTLRTATPYAWKAGQYLSLSMAGFAPRYYSIANAPARDGSVHPEIHVRRAGKGGLSDHLVEHGKAGQPVSVSRPQGETLIRDGETMPLLLVAGGLGIAPLKSLAEQALLQGHTGPVVLVWGTNFPHDQYLKAEFEALAVSDVRFKFVSATGAPVSEQIETLIQDLDSYRIYLAGPPAMIIETKSLLTDKKIPLANIHHDPLPPGFTVPIPASLRKP